MIEYVNNLFLSVNTQNTNTLILTVYAGICLFSLAMRVIICIGYQSNYTFFRLYSKEIKNRADIRESKFGLLNRVIGDYVKSADKSLVRIDARAIVGKYISRLRFLGWSYLGIETFVVGIEQSMIFVGILLAVLFPAYSLAYGLLAAASFLIFKLLATVFDVSLVKEMLTNEITEYVEREVGQFYGADLSAAVFRLKNELVLAVGKQSEAMKGAIEQLGDDLSSTVKTAMEEMSHSVTASLTGAQVYANSLIKPLDDWRESIAAAERLQNNVNASVTGMETAGAKFGSALEFMDTALKEHHRSVAEEGAAVREQLNALVNAAAELKATNAAAAKQNDGVVRALNYIEKNQEILERSLHEYETSLENITERLGDGLSSMVGYQLQNSYSTLNDELQSNLGKITGLNSELLTRLQELFNQVLTQSRGEMKAIIQLKEQLELSQETPEENRRIENKGI